MLPPGYYEQACKLFCRILRRLEERDQRNEHQEVSTSNTEQDDNGSAIESGITDTIRVSSVSTRQQS